MADSWGCVGRPCSQAPLASGPHVPEPECGRTRLHCQLSMGPLMLLSFLITPESLLSLLDSLFLTLAFSISAFLKLYFSLFLPLSLLALSYFSSLPLHFLFLFCLCLLYISMSFSSLLVSPLFHTHTHTNWPWSSSFSTSLLWFLPHAAALWSLALFYNHLGTRLSNRHPSPMMILPCLLREALSLDLCYKPTNTVRNSLYQGATGYGGGAVVALCRQRQWWLFEEN